MKTGKRNAGWLGAYRIAGGFLLGVLIFFSFGVTLTLFRTLPTTAGETVTALFPAYYRFAYGACAVCLICLGFSGARELRPLAAGLFLVLCASALFSVQNLLTPAMRLAKEAGDHGRFSSLHGISMVLNLVAMLGALTATILPRNKGDSEVAGGGDSSARGPGSS